MRKIQIKKWKAKDPDGKDIEESLIDAFTVLISNKKPEEMPRGLDKARLYNRLIKAFDKAKETKELILEEADYNFLKDSLEKDMPSFWGTNKNIMDAVEEFVETKQVEK